jgi:Flp pilus assembly protein TadG
MPILPGMARKSRRRSGQAVVMVTLSIPLMFGVLGLVVDIGWDYWREEAARTAAQAGAYAAARQAQIAGSFTIVKGIYTQATWTTCPASPTGAASNNLMAGCLYAKANGFTNSGKQKVYYQAGTTTSPVTGSSPNYWVRFTAAEQNPSLFSAVLGFTSSVVSARSTAGVFLGIQGACIYALDPSAGSTVNLGGNAIVHAGCGVYDNSSSGTALNCSNNTTLDAGTSAITVSGGMSCGSATVTPTPNLNQPHILDPFLNVPNPTIPARCDHANGSSSDGLNQGQTITMPADGKFVICNAGGISMNSNGSLTLPAGIYIMKGGNIDWRNGNISGTGVTIFMTGPNIGDVSINGNMGVNLTAPLSGTYHGLVLMEDRTIGSPPDLNLNGGATMNFNGTIYAPKATITYTGGSATSVTALVSDKVTFTGTSFFGTDLAGSITGLGVPFSAVIE